MSFGRITLGAAVAAATMVALPGPSSAQNSKARQDGRVSTPAKGSAEKERASGVIVKVDEVKSGSTSDSPKDQGERKGRDRATHRLTINTNAVWRDWARDQSQARDNGSPKKDAAEGKNSVATRGEPADNNSLVVVDIVADTRVETRFRSPDDETSKGTKEPEPVSKKVGPGRNNSTASRPVRFLAADLKPGLFVEVDFRHASAQNPASILTVIRPIGGPDSGSADRPK